MSDSRLSGLELIGCFATDGLVHAEARHTPDGHLPLDLPASLFRPAEHPSDDSGTAMPDDVFSVTPPDGTPRDHTTVRVRRSTQVGTVPTEDGLPTIGTVLDKYRIEEVLGAGGFATVYRATHLLMRTSVALKVLHPWILERRPDLSEQLCEEARFTSLIDHPNVVRIADVTNDEDYTYIVMEYIDGQSLGRAIEKGRLRPLEVLRIGLHVCAGLQAGLEQGLVHRDIKPGNILLARTGKAKIVDFGLARNLGGSATDSTQIAGMTNGEIAGTPAYMAPEQATDFAGADFRADMYSLGATLFHAATGVPPFTEPDPLRLIYAHINHLPPDPQELVPGFPERVSAIILRLLAKRPAERYATYAELGADLRQVYEQLKRQGETPRPTELFRRVKNMFTTRRE